MLVVWVIAVAAAAVVFLPDDVIALVCVTLVALVAPFLPEAVVVLT
jgi:hypothetical protein